MIAYTYTHSLKTYILINKINNFNLYNNINQYLLNLL